MLFITKLVIKVFQHAMDNFFLIGLIQLLSNLKLSIFGIRFINTTHEIHTEIHTHNSSLVIVTCCIGAALDFDVNRCTSNVLLLRIDLMPWMLFFYNFSI